jgi:hypothetical protein
MRDVFGQARSAWSFKLPTCFAFTRQTFKFQTFVFPIGDRWQIWKRAISGVLTSVSMSLHKDIHKLQEKNQIFNCECWNIPCNQTDPSTCIQILNTVIKNSLCQKIFIRVLEVA